MADSAPKQTHISSALARHDASSTCTAWSAHVATGRAPGGMPNYAPDAALASCRPITPTHPPYSPFSWLGGKSWWRSPQLA